jgi:hypothetical protein
MVQKKHIADEMLWFPYFFRAFGVYCLRYEFAMALAPSFRPDQSEAIYIALKRASARFAEAIPVIEIIGDQDPGTYRAGEFDPDS